MSGFDVWLDEFFAAYYRQQPVNATFIGVHAYDARLRPPEVARLAQSRRGCGRSATASGSESYGSEQRR